MHFSGATFSFAAARRPRPPRVTLICSPPANAVLAGGESIEVTRGDASDGHTLIDLTVLAEREPWTAAKHYFYSKSQCMRRDVFQAIADPTRRQILQLLSRQELTLNGISEHFEVSRPAISKHIRILTECGLVTIKQQGRERFCSGELSKLKEVAEWLKPYQAFWNNKLDALAQFLDAPPGKKTKSKK